MTSHKRKLEASVPTLRELAFEVAASEDCFLSSLRQMPEDLKPELIWRGIQAVKRPLEQEIKRLKTEKVSWCNEVLATPDERKGGGFERERLRNNIPGYTFSVTPAPLAMNYCSRCASAFTTIIERSYHAMTPPICGHCVRDYK